MATGKAWKQPAVGQKSLFDQTPGEKPSGDRSGSFVDNMQLPVHRWFRYSAGFSAEWVRQVLLSEAKGRSIHVLDPFVGSGTVVLEAERAGVQGLGVESHPFVARIAGAKLHWREAISMFRQMGAAILKAARAREGNAANYPPLITKCFPPEPLAKLDALRHSTAALAQDSGCGELCWLALVSILRPCAPVGTAQWQYILPKKSKVKALEPFAAFSDRLELMAEDMRLRQFEENGPSGCVLTTDARSCQGVEDAWADLVVTSPPYANNYDYADATRLELTFLGEVQGWGDLQTTIRRHLVRSCTQHVASAADRAASLLGTKELAPITDELKAVYSELDRVKDNRGGKKPYHAMIAHYFYDLAQVWAALRRVTRKGGRVCFVVGDSAPYGVHVPVERWLGELAVAAGFHSYRFEKVRDRNTKWKNRKHRVLLQEGRLWVEG